MHFTNLEISLMLFVAFGLLAVFRNRQRKVAVSVIDHKTLRFNVR